MVDRLVHRREDVFMHVANENSLKNWFLAFCQKTGTQFFVNWPCPYAQAALASVETAYCFTAFRKIIAGRRELHDRTKDGELEMHLSTASLQKIKFHFF